MSQHHTVHIGNFTTNRRSGYQRNAVGSGFGNEFLMPGYLKVHKLTYQYAEKHDNYRKCRHQP